jgi:phasin family protein
MFATQQQLSSVSQTNIETLATFANTAFASAERLAALNLSTARSILEDSFGTAKTLMSAKNPQELIALQSALAQPALDKAMAYSRGLYEIANQTQGVLGKLFEGQVSEINTNVANALDKAAKNAPAGADVAIAAVKSAIAATNTAFDNMNKAAKQAAEITEANVAAAANATFKAMKAA